MGVKVRVTAMIGVAVIACSGSNGAECVSSPSIGRPLPELSVVRIDSGWREKALADLAPLPDDRQFESGFFFPEPIIDADRQYITDHGGRITYEFRGFSAAAVTMRVADLRVALQTPYARLVTVILTDLGPKGTRLNCR
jgi:hypothetical protein